MSEAFRIDDLALPGRAMLEVGPECCKHPEPSTTNRGGSVMHEESTPVVEPVEEWRAVVGFEGRYEVSALGWVRSLPRTVLRRNGAPYTVRGQTLNPWVAGDGYAWVTLARGSRHMVHSLILYAFVGPCPDGMECCHWNGVRTDNRLENLRWGTRLENMADRRRHRTQSHAR